MPFTFKYLLSFQFCFIFIFFKSLSILNPFFCKYFTFPSILLHLHSFCNLSFLFMTHFLYFLFFYFHHCFLLMSYMSLFLIQQILSWFVLLIHLSLIQLLFCLFLQVSVSVKSFFNIFCNVFAIIICFHMNNEVLVLDNHTKIHILQFYSDLILIILKKLAYSLMFQFFYFYC